MWFETLFNYPREAFASGELVVTNVVEPLWWLIGAGVGSAALVASVFLGRRTRGLAWWKRSTITLLQCAMLFVALLVLANPALQTTTLKPGANSVALLVDTSGSMAFPNAADPGDCRA